MVVSKVIIYESDDSVLSKLLRFCEDNNLIAIRDNSDSMKQILMDQDLDIGAVFVNEGYLSRGMSGYNVAQEISKVRPEIPLLFRVEPLYEHDSE